jgi:hypothetical protein
MDDPVLDPMPEIDPDRLSICIDVFKTALNGVPQSVDLVNRGRMALDALPDEVVREIGKAASVLAKLAGERLGSPLT